MRNVSRKKRILLVYLGLFVFCSSIIYAANANHEEEYEDVNDLFTYISPQPGADFVSNGTSIAFRGADISAQLLPQTLSNLYWTEDQLSLNEMSFTAEENMPDYVSAPADIPRFEVTGDPQQTGEGYIFIGYFDFTQQRPVKPYGLILENSGEPVYYTDVPIPIHLDFKKQPNGLLTMFSPVPQPPRFYALDETYQLVKTYQAGNGYNTDNHDLQILDNGHALLLVHDWRVVDMSQYVPGGNPEARVIGCIIQELDTADNVVFEWQSWDHISILDSNQDLTADQIRYIHCNSIERDRDGNLLLSSRHLDEITKINRETGEIIWRMGGKQNEFDFLNDEGFNFQHDARRLANGHISIYDNGVAHNPPYSRGVEYLVDESNKTVTLVAEFRKDPDHFAVAMGNMQRLPNGNSIVGWGTSRKPILTEFDQNGQIVFELTDTGAGGTYRAFRFPWQGFPTVPPNLVTQVDGKNVKLFFSWNGSTETEAYEVLGGQDRDNLQRIGTATKQGFETTYEYTLPEEGLWYFQVIPVDKEGDSGLPSNLSPVVIGGKPFYLPVSFSDN